MRGLVTWLIAIAVVLLLVALWFVNTFWSPVDSCLDLGGRWDSASSTCDGNAYPLPDPLWPFR